jgi:hypothetical protein
LAQPGVFTWPLVQLAHVFVRRNLTFIEDPRAQSLLKTFLQSLYEEEYILQCETDYEFTRVSGPALDLAKTALDRFILSPEAPEWTFETETQKLIGAGDYVASAKRRSIEDIELELLGLSIQALEQQVSALNEALDKSSLELSALSFKVALQENAAAASGGASSLMTLLLFSSSSFWRLMVFLPMLTTGLSLLPCFFF